MTAPNEKTSELSANLGMTIGYDVPLRPAPTERVPSAEGRAGDPANARHDGKPTTTDPDADPYHVLVFCAGAIRDACLLEDGLDCSTADAVLSMIDRAMKARTHVPSGDAATADGRLAKILARIRGIGPDWSDEQHTSVPVGDLRYLASRLAGSPPAQTSEGLTAEELFALNDVLGTGRDDEPDYNGWIDSLDIARRAVQRLASSAPPSPGGRPEERET